MQGSLQSLVWESIVIWLVVLCISEILVSRSVGQWETKNFSGMALRDSYWYRCSLLSLAGILNDDSNNGGHSSTTSPRNISSMFILNILEDTILLTWNWRASANCVSALFELHAVLLNYETTIWKQICVVSNNC